MDEIIPYGHQTLYASDISALHEHITLYFNKTKDHEEETTAHVHGPNVTHDDILYRYIFIQNNKLLAATDWYRDRDDARAERDVMIRKNINFTSVLPQTGSLALQERTADGPLRPKWTYNQVMQAIANNIVARDKPFVDLDATGADIDIDEIVDWVTGIGYRAEPYDDDDTIRITKKED
ncbi:MAG: hypothetical protein HDQ88_08290 [Clostridia bacterium]|nr:hypothetical protein [Clostridia bacterium]